MIRLAPAKVNIFLKITATRGHYHELRSRFIRIDTLHDRLSFTRKKEKENIFELHTSVPLPADNTIAKAYRLLKNVAPSIETFFESHAVYLEKNIPQGAGLGGGSSDAAAFLTLCNEVCSLKLSKEYLAKIGEKIGADVPFFIYDYPSANVEGIGEVIIPFEEEPPKPELFTPPIHCDTAKVYKTFRTHFGNFVDPEAATEWLHIDSETLLRTLEPLEANDLYRAALVAYPQLQAYQTPSRFFSGSGSTFFSLPPAPTSSR